MVLKQGEEVSSLQYIPEVGIKTETKRIVESTFQSPKLQRFQDKTFAQCRWRPEVTAIKRQLACLTPYKHSATALWRKDAFRLVDVAHTRVDRVHRKCHISPK